MGRVRLGGRRAQSTESGVSLAVSAWRTHVCITIFLEGIYSSAFALAEASLTAWQNRQIARFMHDSADGKLCHNRAFGRGINTWCI